jgi:hypothetical protein
VPVLSSTALPPLAGRAAELRALLQARPALLRPAGSPPLERIRSAFACALHMHQPTIPAGPDGELI